MNNLLLNFKLFDRGTKIEINIRIHRKKNKKMQKKSTNILKIRLPLENDIIKYIL